MSRSSGCPDVDVVVAAGGASWEEAAIREIEGASSLRLTRRCVDVHDLLAVAHTGRAAAAFVSDDLAGLDLDAVAQLELAGVLVVAVGSDLHRGEALGIGRRSQLGRLADIALEVPAPPAEVSERSAPVVAVWGPAGAPGRSTVALSLAAATAARGIDTVLVDADTHGGALGQLLGVLDDVSGLVAACRAVNNGRPAEVVDHVLEIDPGLRLLTGLPRSDMWPQVRLSAFDGVLERLRAASQLVVVDTGSSLEPATGPGAARSQTAVQVVGAADVLVVVGRPDPVGLARLVRALHDVSTVAPDCLPLVAMNLMRSSLGWREKEVTAAVTRLGGTEPVVHLPFDQSSLDLAAVSGRAPREVAPASPFVAGVEVLVSHVLAEVGPPGALVGSDR